MVERCAMVLSVFGFNAQKHRRSSTPEDVMDIGIGIATTGGAEHMRFDHRCDKHRIESTRNIHIHVILQFCVCWRLSLVETGCSRVFKLDW